MPFFSIILPTYNRPSELKRAVSSVLNQCFSDFELLIINNGDSLVIGDFKDARIRFITEEKKGANYARNKGIENAKGTFICFLDDDDEYLPNHLEVMRNLITENNSEVGFYRTFAKREIKPGVYVDQKDPLKPANMHNLHYSFLYPIYMNSVCIHKDILKQQRFNPEVKVAQDYDLWIRIMAEHKLFITDTITTVYHLSGDSISKPSKEKYYYYIKLFKSYFDNPKYGKLLPKSLKSDRIFKYYYWIFCEYKKDLGFFEFINIISKIIFYKPVMLLNKELYATILKSK